MATAAAAAALTWVGGVLGEGGPGPAPPQCQRGREEEREEKRRGGVVIPVRPDPNYLVPGREKRRREEKRKEGDAPLVTRLAFTGFQVEMLWKVSSLRWTGELHMCTGRSPTAEELNFCIYSEKKKKLFFPPITYSQQP